MKTQNGSHRSRGFSLLELVVVVAIMFVVAAMAMPTMTNAIADYKLKSTASQLVNLLQRARTESVRANFPVGVLTQVQAGRQVVWVDVSGNGVRDATEPTLIMPERTTLQTAGFPGDATVGQNPANYRVMPQAPPAAGQFNARGLPCWMMASIVAATQTCRNTDNGNNAQGFVYYIRSDRPFGLAGWAAVVVTPAGRIRSTTWANNSYQ